MPEVPNGNSSQNNGHGLSMRAGRGRSIAQHGELFQGQVDDEHDRPRRCLLSLPCRALYSQATFHPDGSGRLTVYPSSKEKARETVRLVLAELNAADVGGSITIESSVPEAKGYGSSTADCVAAALSAADALGRVLAEEDLARLVVEAEVASDNFMFRHAVLFAHREGVVLEYFTKYVPKLEVLGIDTAREAQVKTLEFPPASYSWRQRQSFGTLRSALRRAIQTGDINLLGRLATASACINELFLPKPMFSEVHLIAEKAKALGVAVAHSGTVVSILLDPDDELLQTKVDQIQNDLHHLGISEVLRFQT
jgi:uncharacterized protein involved in propanediol utilization